MLLWESKQEQILLILLRESILRDILFSVVSYKIIAKIGNV